MTRMVRRALGTTAAGIIMAGLAVTGAAAQTPPPSASVMERALESRAKGEEGAPLVVFEIADFQCPYCARFAADVAPALHEKYVEAGKVQWVFVNLPLHSHPLAWLAAEAALCTGVAGGDFWTMHDRLFEEQDRWGRLPDPSGRFLEYARAQAVDEDAYRTCVDRDQVAALILQDLGSAVSAGISGTPTFIIMRGQDVVERLVGLKSIEEWSRVLDDALGAEGGR